MKLFINLRFYPVSAFLIIISLLIPIMGCASHPAKTAQDMQAEIITETALGAGDIIEVKFYEILD